MPSHCRNFKFQEFDDIPPSLAAYGISVQRQETHDIIPILATISLGQRTRSRCTTEKMKSKRDNKEEKSPSINWHIQATALKSIRHNAEQILSSLTEEDDDSRGGNIYNSWIRGMCAKEGCRYPTKNCRFFDKHGFLLIKGFSNGALVAAMKDQMRTLVDESWNPDRGKKAAIFRTDEKQVDAQGSDNYFLESANKIHFFAEKDSMDDNGKLKDEFLDRKMNALNKAGHGLHLIPGAFRNYTLSDKVKNLVRELGWIDPVVPQSMYIFKQPWIGSEVTSHQDSTFLYTTPKQSCLGLWLALDDATLDNGCLWVRPASHRESLRRKFVRNPEHFADSVELRSNAPNGDTTKPQMIFVNEASDDSIRDVPWEGKLPDGSFPPCDGLFKSGFVPIECKAGDLVVFPGELDHLSLPNFSKFQRHTFQLHLVEGEKAGVKWADSNWLQYPRGTPFMSIK